MGKHAYCIITHGDPYCLNVLTHLLDDSRNDIFIHVDKKVNIDIIKHIKLKYSRLITPPL